MVSRTPLDWTWPGAIVGYFTTGEIRRVSAVRPGTELARAGAVTPQELRDYFKGLEHGYAIEVKRPRRLQYGVRLARGESGPQIYRFLRPRGRDRRLVQRLVKATS